MIILYLLLIKKYSDVYYKKKKNFRNKIKISDYNNIKYVLKIVILFKILILIIIKFLKLFSVSFYIIK